MRASGDANAAFMRDLAEGALEVDEGRFARGLELTEAAARSGSARHDYARERLTQAWRCEVLMMLDRVGESRELPADGIAAASATSRPGRCTPSRRGEAGNSSCWAGCTTPRRSWRASSASSRRSPTRASSTLRDRRARARGAAPGRRLQRITAARARAMLDDSPPSFRRQAAWLLALQAMAAGDATTAHMWCVAGEDVRTSVLPLFPVAVAAEARAASNPGVGTIAAGAAHARGLLAGEDELARAVELFDGAPRPLALASALEDLGAVRADAGIEALDRALALYSEAGAAWDAGRVRSRLREQGVRRRLATHDRPQTGWGAMTDSERAVAQFVAQGLTNREVAEQLFVSPHTVNTHLRHVYAKLEINSRLELARLAGARVAGG